MRKIQKKILKSDRAAEAARPVYLIASSIQYVLGQLLKTKSAFSQKEFLKRLDEEATYLKINIKLLRKEVERAKKIMRKKKVKKQWVIFKK